MTDDSDPTPTIRTSDPAPRAPRGPAAGDARGVRTRPAPGRRGYSPAPEPRGEWPTHRAAPDRRRPSAGTSPPRPGRRRRSTRATSAAAGRAGGAGRPGTVVAAALARRRSSPRAARSSRSARPAPSIGPRPPPPSAGRARRSARPSRSRIDESSATIDVAAKVSPAVVRITVSGSVDTEPGVIPETGVGSGVIYDSQRLDPDQPPRRRGQRQDRRSSSRTAASSPARSTASTP